MLKNETAGQALRLLATENDGDTILDLQIMKFSLEEYSPNPPSLFLPPPPCNPPCQRI